VTLGDSVPGLRQPIDSAPAGDPVVSSEPSRALPVEQGRSPGAVLRADAGAIRRFWRSLGPGLVTGAADDDPSGIATYSIAGAQFGTALLWTAIVCWPLMTAVQMMCARIGMVTGRGLAAAFRQRFPRWVILAAAAGLLVANTLNVGADLAGMADAAAMLTAVHSHLWVIGFGVFIAGATLWLHYPTFEQILKWLALVLLAYVVAAFQVGPHWLPVLKATLTPHVPSGGWGTVVAVFGTTISPYLFFWQASQEVEEEKAQGLIGHQRLGATRDDLDHRKVDVVVGTFASQVASFFIILTTALTLHVHGLTNLETSRQVADALQPLAGRFAAFLYTIGLVGVGALAIPTLAGSGAYALAEIFNWRQGIDTRPRRARAFYAVIVLSLAAGVALDFAGVNPVKALYWTAIVNGLVAPFLLVGIVLIASDRTLMQNQPSSRASQAAVWAAAALMFGAAVGMFAF
jgi:NRAMP (natural resistance-associated macrophage protein)-like metal ion transporter